MTAPLSPPKYLKFPLFSSNILYVHSLSTKIRSNFPAYLSFRNRKGGRKTYSKGRKRNIQKGREEKGTYRKGGRDGITQKEKNRHLQQGKKINVVEREKENSTNVAERKEDKETYRKGGRERNIQKASKRRRET